MASNPIVAKYSAEKKTLVFSVDPYIYDAYKKGKTCKEMYLPHNELWTERVLSEGWSMNPGFKSFKIQIFNKATGATINTSCWSLTVRMAPIRPFERADKHIVLFLR
jgi:hypothetical protein